MKVRFTSRYDHRWPSRAVTSFPPGYEGTVKREVGELAISKGKATAVQSRDKPARNEPASANAIMGRSRGMAESHDDDHVGAVLQRAIVDGADQ